MAAPASEDRWRRWDDDELRVGEEGEVVSGCHSETDTDEYYNRHSPIEYDDEADSGRKGATTSVVVVVPVNNGSDAASTSSSVARAWGGTGKRGRPGTAVSPSAEPDLHSMAAVAAADAKAVLQPMPLAFSPPSTLPASSVPMSSAARTNLSGQSSSASEQSAQHGDAVNTVLAAAGAGAATPCPRAEAAVIHHQPVVAPPPPRPPAAGRQNPDGYTCPKCGLWFATHQGLGGHSVGHKHRERAASSARDDDDAKRRERRVHVCGDCGAEFATGVQLGGHKRKHWAGAPIVPKKKKPRAAGAVVLDQRLPPPTEAARAAAAALTLALAVVKADEMSDVGVAAPLAVEPETVVETAPQPVTGLQVAGSVRLFGVDIVPAVQTPQEQQGSPASATKSLGDPPAGSSSHI